MNRNEIQIALKDFVYEHIVYPSSYHFVLRYSYSTFTAKFGLNFLLNRFTSHWYDLNRYTFFPHLTQTTCLFTLRYMWYTYTKFKYSKNSFKNIPQDKKRTLTFYRQ